MPTDRGPSRDPPFCGASSPEPGRFAHEVRAWLLLSALLALVLGPLIWLGLRYSTPRQAAPAVPIAAPAPAWASDTDCRAPLKPGETLQVVFRHDGGAITFRCQSYTDWRALRQLTDKGAPQ